MSEEAAVADTGDNAAIVADAIDRPENVPEKFWNNETKSVNNDQVLESYNQLSSKFGAFTGAPETYEFALSEQLTEAGITLDNESPLITQFTEMAKESNMSQEMANKFINMYVEGQHADSIGAGEAEEARITEQMGLLGDNANQRVQNIENWAKANLTPEQVAGLEDATTTAAGVQAVEALIAKSRNAPMQNSDIAETSAVDMAEVQAMQFEKDDNGNRRLQTDPEFRKRFNALMDRAHPGENIITVG